MKFRYDIGALRAFSVLIVVLFHFKVPFFSGGFLGVDIFFVISGFLMTKIILSGIEKNTFNFFQFYLKRYKRIVPALLFLLLFIILTSIILFLPQDLRLNSKYVFLSPVFLSNIYFWLYSGYFDASSQTNILLHSWSLSVEWQFYLIYPLLIWPLRKLYLNNKNAFISIFITFTMLSFLLMIFLTKDYNSFSFYMFPTRAWEMTMGGLAALIPLSFFDTLKINKSKNVIVIFCYITLCLCTVFINETMLWPSLFTLIPVFAVFLILYFNTEFENLRNKKLQFIGNISYSLYLWHWPLYIISNYYGFNSQGSILFLLLLSFALASFSYYKIENNLIFNDEKRITLFLITILLISAGLFFRPINGVVKRISIFDSGLLEDSFQFGTNSSEREKQFNPCGCFLSQNLKIEDYNEQKCLFIDPNKENILLLGDSHAAQISLSLREKLPKKYHLSEASVSYAFPFLKTKGRKDSKRLMEKVFVKFVEKNQDKISLVIISAHWLMYKSNQIGYNEKSLINDFQETLEFFKKKNIKVIIIGQTESYTISYPKIIALSKTFGKNLEKRYLNKEGYELNNMFKKKYIKSGYFDVYNHPEMIRYNEDLRKPYMFDDNHLTNYGADQMIEIILKKII